MMTRKIKASEVREGMEIRWEEDGAVIRLPVFEVMEGTCGRVSFVPESRTPWHVKRDQVVTVLREPQPDEPTEFGAAVEVAGVKYVLASHFSQARWVDEYDQWNRWGTLCERGPVEVKPNPFATPSQDATEPRTWERWEDVPEMTPVRVIETPYRKVGDHIECKPVNAWEPAFTDEYELNEYSPLTEVLVSTVS